MRRSKLLSLIYVFVGRNEKRVSREARIENPRANPSASTSVEGLEQTPDGTQDRGVFIDPHADD